MFDFNPQLITAYIKTEDQQQLEINLQESNSDLQFYWQNEFTLVLRLSFSKRINISTTKIKIPFKFDTKDKVLLNGYQSWTETALYSIEDTPRAPFSGTLKFFKPYGDYDWQICGARRSFSFSFLERPQKYLFIGAIQEVGGYVIIEYAPQENAIYIHKDCKYYSFTEDELLFELFIQVGNNLQTLQAHYLEQKKLGIRKVPSLTGWTSWYYHYTHINQKIIEQNLRAFQPYPIDLFQIDDGWQQAVGDWQVNSKRFPDGMKKLADAIHIQGYKAGLWLAPLVCEPKSKIFQAHKDWLLIDDKGKPIRAGFNPLWGGWLRPWFYALDIHNPQVQGYLRKVLFQILENWQFDLVKLDFLYAATLAPQRNRYTEMEFAIQFLRECVGNKWILACGVPLANAYHHVEYCRIGADVSLRWDTPILAQLGARERISTFSTLVATLYRQFLNGKLFYNDPDVFILRKQANHLTKYEKQTLLLLNSLAGGLVLTSDNPAEYDLETDQLFKRLFPHCIKTIVQIEESDLLFKIMCEAGAFNYTIYANLSNKKRSITLESQFYYDSMADRHYAPDTKLVLVQHQSIGLLNINISNEAPSFAGSQSHLFAGLELIECNICGHKIRLSVHKQAFPNAKYYFFIPEKNSGILINGGMLETKDLAILKPFQLKLGIWQNSSK